MNRTQKILLTGGNLWYLGEGMLGPLYAIFAERVGGDILDITWSWAIFLGVQGVMMIIFGRITDRVNSEKLMIWGYGLNALFTFGYILVDSPIKLFILQAGLGLASAIATPPWNALYDKYSDDKRNGYLWGAADGQALIVTAVAMIIGGYILSSYSFTVLFLVMGTIQVVSTFYQAKIIKCRKRYRKRRS